MSDYERMAAVIRYLAKAYRGQPGLRELAAALDLSPSHFHRLFQKWAGLTPKDFVQSLTAAHAKRLLRRGINVLDAALESGLSGPGRLHDLCVSLEAATPGEIRNGGQGLAIQYGFAPSPFGDCLVAHTPRGILALSFVTGRDGAGAEESLCHDWPAASLARSDSLARRIADQVFPPVPSTPPHLKAYVRGSAFQVRVWRALLQIPPGAVVSYGRLAASLGSPQAARAVGNAVGANPLACLIPCHRVIQESGAVGGYRWGADRKRALLAAESTALRTSFLDDPDPAP